MELRRFQQFLTLAEAGSFTAAAAQLYMAQSSLSASIAALESDLGVQLLLRSRHGVELTEAGKAFLEPARQTVSAAAQARQAAVGQHDRLPALRVADTFAAATLAAETAAEALAEMWPTLEIDVRHYGLRNVTDRVVAGEIDVAFTPINRPLPEGVDVTPLGMTPIALLCAPGHRLAGARGIDFGDLAGERFITMPGDSSLREHPIRALDGLTDGDRIHVEVDSWVNALSLVRRGYGLTFGPEYDTDYYPPDIAMATFADPPVMHSAIVTAHQPDPHPALGDFLDLYRSRCDDDASSVAPRKVRQNPRSDGPKCGDEAAWNEYPAEVAEPGGRPVLVRGREAP